MTEANWNQEEIERHLASAVHTLTPDVLSRIDLDTPQKIYTGPSKTVKLYRRLRTVGMAAAACLCTVVLGTGVNGYVNSRVESVIGLDVNPSIELSVNRKEKVLKANPLNGDAEIILDDMDLKGVDLDIAVNALVGSMVRNGYLTELENAILVSVSNEDAEKAALLRQDVVIDIEESLEAHQVQAVVYDQQAPEKDEVRELSETYQISYGKAYFLQELVEENNLTDEDLKLFAEMTMEEIAREIAERSYTVRTDGALDGQLPETDPAQAVSPSEPETEAVPPELELQETESIPEESISMPETEAVPAETKSDSSLTETSSEKSASEDPDEEEEAVSFEKARIDDVEYEDGMLDVIFDGKVTWKNPTVSVQDDLGQSYSARILDTSSDSCTIQVRGLPGGAECSFTLAGVALKESKSYGSVKGYFEVPEIAEEAEPNVPVQDEEPEPTEDTEVQEEEEASVEEPSEEEL